MSDYPDDGRALLAMAEGRCPTCGAGMEWSPEHQYQCSRCGDWFDTGNMKYARQELKRRAADHPLTEEPTDG